MPLLNSLCFHFLLLLFHSLLILGLLMFTKSFKSLTLSPLINKAVGQNLANWSLPLVQQCCGGLRTGGSVAAGLRMLLSVSGRSRRDNRADRRYKASRLYICCWKVRKHAVKRWDRGSRAHVCTVFEVQCTFYRGGKCLSTVLCSTQFTRCKTMVKKEYHQCKCYTEDE